MGYLNLPVQGQLQAVRRELFDDHILARWSFVLGTFKQCILQSAYTMRHDKNTKSSAEFTDLP